MNINEEKMIRRFQQMIRCATVSDRNQGPDGSAPFLRFPELLRENYPLVHETLVREPAGPKGMLYHWKGRENTAPTVLMSHYDVVPAEENLWSKPPFDGAIEEEYVYGRGTLDTKGTLWGIMEAAEELIERGFAPEQDIYFAFSGDEETGGGSAPAMVQAMKDRGIRPALVLDEGGAVLTDIFPGVNAPCALIGTAEKGYLNVELIAEGQGGHSSTPPRNTPIEKLAKGVLCLQRNPFPPRLTAPVKEMLKTLGQHSTPLIRLMINNLWLFGPLLFQLIHRRGGKLDAILRTTCTPTMMDGSKAINVLPATARIGCNLRLLPGDSIEFAMQRLQRLMANEGIKVIGAEGNEASACSKTGGPLWDKVRQSVEFTWPQVLVSPFLMIGATDSRHYHAICDRVYRFTPICMSEEDLDRIHGNDERVSLDALMKIRTFYIRLMEQC